MSTTTIQGGLPRFLLLMAVVALAAAMPVSAARSTEDQTSASSAVLLAQLHSAFGPLEPQTISPAAGIIPHDYLIPAGYYHQMWDWDGFFIGLHFAHQSRAQAVYLKWWVMNFASAADRSGYVSGCVTPEGERRLFGKFAMKPFLAQGAYFAARRLGDDSWIPPIWDTLQRVIAYRERTQFDPKYGLYFWNNAMQSGADNNAALTNDPTQPDAILAVDASFFQYREYRAMQALAVRLHRPRDVARYKAKADRLRTAIRRYFWSPRDAMFWNIWRRTGAPVRSISWSSFVPLIGDILSPAEAKQMIRRHLLNPNEMLAPYGFRSLTKDDPEYNEEAMIKPYSNWRGPIWINANFLDYIALRRYGFHEQAHWLASSLARMLIADIHRWGSMHEDYDADTGKGLAPTAAESPNHRFAGFVGWNLLAEDILHCDVTGNCLDFRIEPSRAMTQEPSRKDN